MTFADLRARYSENELSYFPGDRQLRYEAFAPILQNLFENKLVYNEKFIGLVRLEDVKITPEKFWATAIPLISMRGDDALGYAMPTTPWTFGGGWDWMRLINNSINVPYAAWTIWPEHDRVQAVERLLMDGNFKEAWNLTCREPEVAHGK